MTPKLALWLTWLVLTAGVTGYAWAQLFAPNQIDGCVVVASAPTYTAGERAALTCNLSGQLRMSTTP